MNQMVVHVIDSEQLTLVELFPRGECQELLVVKGNSHVDIGWVMITRGCRTYEHTKQPLLELG
jgi:hypothetical protein